MTDPVVVVGVTIGAVVLFRLVYMYVVSGGQLGRYFQGQAIALQWLRNKEFETKVNNLLKPPPPPKPSAEPIRLLALMQREGRLMDFLLEDIQAYSDDQVGAAVRDIHRHCKKVVQEHLTLEPVLPHKEGDQVPVPAGFDPSAIRLTGNVTGEPPFKGELKHHGWRVKEIKLAPAPEGQDQFVVQPAEVELP